MFSRSGCLFVCKCEYWKRWCQLSDIINSTKTFIRVWWSLVIRSIPYVCFSRVESKLILRRLQNNPESCRNEFIIQFLISGRFLDAQPSVCVSKRKTVMSWPVRYRFSIVLMSSDVCTSFYWLHTSKQCSFRDCWTPDISFDAAFLQLSIDQREREQRAASQQQSPLITVRAISKNPNDGYKGLSLQRRFHYSFLSLPFLCLAKKRNKGGTLLTEN